jgi:putative glycosyltransferase (TIGR04372 family)
MLWKIFSRTLSIVLLPVSALSWILRLAPWFSRIADADVVVLMTAPTGFGHSLIGPDLMRRLYPGQRCLFFIASWLYEHNHKVSLLWKDLDVVFISRLITAIPYRHRVIAIPFLRWHDAMAIWLTRKIVTLVSGGRARFQTVNEMYHDALALKNAWPPAMGTGDDKKKGADGVKLMAQLQLLQMRKPESPVRLPEEIRNDITPRLERLWREAGHEGAVKLCCLYLRYEKRESYTTRLRNSSSLEHHLSAVRLLGEAGYQVLLTGDFEIDDATRKGFRGALVDERDLGVDRDIYQLFAGSQADIFIGNHGGGEILAIVNEIPSLYLDWFPYSHGRKNAWVYFKAARDKDGHLFPGRRLITDFVYDSAASFGTLINNTQEEITDAVACFIEDVKSMDAPDPYANVATLIPEDTQFHITGARLSPAWVRRNILSEGELESSVA